MSALFCGFAGLGLIVSRGKDSASAGQGQEVGDRSTMGALRLSAGPVRDLSQGQPGTLIKDDGGVRRSAVRQSGDEVRREA